MTALQKTRRRRLVVIAAGVSLTLALVGCSAQNDPAPSLSDAPLEGGVLRVGLGPGLICVDPHQVVTAEGRAVATAISDTLAAFDATTNEVVPWLARSWTVNDDATAYTFSLREDVTFSDGTPFTAEVVKANFDTTVERLAVESPGASVYLAAYAETTVDDPYTATVHFAAPSPSFLIGASTQLAAMLSPETLDKSAEERCQGDVIGTGPFVLEEFANGERATVSRRSDYAWPSPLSDNDGAAYLDSVVFSATSVGSVREGELQSGQLDAVLGVGGHVVAGLEAGGYSVTRGVIPGISVVLIPNPTEGRPLEDEAVRSALQIAFDRVRAASAASNDVYPAAVSPLTSNMYGWIDLSDAMVADTEGAGELLEAADWTVGDDGIREKAGTSLTLRVSYTPDFGPVYEPMLTLIQEQVREAGIDLVLVNTTAAGLGQAITDGAYDLLAVSVTQADPDVLGLIYGPYGLFLDPELLLTTGVTELLEAVRETPNGPERQNAVEQLQAVLVDSGLSFPLFENVEILASAPNVGGLGLDAQSKLVLQAAWIAE